MTLSETILSLLLHFIGGFIGGAIAVVIFFHCFTFFRKRNKG
jgi:hypothetical protein